MRLSRIVLAHYAGSFGRSVNTWRPKSYFRFYKSFTCGTRRAGFAGNAAESRQSLGANNLSLNELEQNLVKSAGQNLSVEIEYDGRWRLIDPLYFKEGKTDALLVAKCHLRSAIRSFMVGKIKEVRITKQHFVREIKE